jgi:hypothetical protein
MESDPELAAAIHEWLLAADLRMTAAMLRKEMPLVCIALRSTGSAFWSLLRYLSHPFPSFSASTIVQGSRPPRGLSDLQVETLGPFIQCSLSSVLNPTLLLCRQRILPPPLGFGLATGAARLLAATTTGASSTAASAAGKVRGEGFDGAQTR